MSFKNAVFSNPNELHLTRTGEYFENGAFDEKEIMDIPSNTQQVERHVQMVSQAGSYVFGYEARQEIIRIYY